MVGQRVFEWSHFSLFHTGFSVELPKIQFISLEYRQAKVHASSLSVLQFVSRMSQKRQKGDDSKPQQDCGTSDDKRRRKIPSLKSAILQVINLRKVHNYIEPVLEPLIRKVVSSYC
nr:calmodulin-binding protein 60 A-like isoform X1 [Ipomoea batatas]